MLSYFALAGLALIWGASFLFIKVAVQDMSPAALVLIRSASGFVALAAVVAVMRGFTLLHEAVTLPIVVGMVVILGGIVLTNVRRRTAGVQPDSEADAAAA